jgi:hypothetical protein
MSPCILNRLRIGDCLAFMKAEEGGESGRRGECHDPSAAKKASNTKALFGVLQEKRW